MPERRIGTRPSTIPTSTCCGPRPKPCQPLLGGADSIYVAPFDECYKTHDEVSRRLARNTQIILKQEALLARVADPGGGSYYLETLTDSIARKAWKQFQEIEAVGGFRKATAIIARDT